MTQKQASMTAGEWFAKSDTDLKYQALRRERDLELSRIAEDRRQEQQCLLNDLALAGAVVNWVGQLLEIPAPDERIYPVLLNHITKPYSPWLLEWIGRAFGRKSARPIVFNVLVNAIKNHVLAESAAEGVMFAISEMSSPSDLDIIIDLLSDLSLGSGRIYLVSNLMRSKRPEARTALLQNQDDPYLNKEITARLSKSRGQRPHFKFTGHLGFPRGKL